MFKLPKVAVRKIHVFRGLMDSIFGLPLCVFLICHKEAVVAISDHFEKVCRSNLFEFSVSGIIGKFQFNKALVFSQQSFAKIFMWLVVTNYYTPPLWSFKLTRLENKWRDFD